MKSALRNQPSSGSSKRASFFGIFGRSESRSSSISSSPGPKRVSLVDRIFRRNPTEVIKEPTKSEEKKKGKKNPKGKNESESDGSESETEERSDKDASKVREKSKTLNARIHPSPSVAFWQ